MNIISKIKHAIRSRKADGYNITVTRSILENKRHAKPGHAFYIVFGKGPEGVYRSAVEINTGPLTKKLEEELIEMLKAKMLKHISNQ